MGSSAKRFLRGADLDNDDSTGSEVYPVNDNPVPLDMNFPVPFLVVT
jgi:hypothetical protein